MQFDSWAAFWNMGGYAFFVWSSFLVTGIAMGAIAIESVLARRYLEQQVKREQGRRQRIRDARHSNTSSS
ncbi:heme exporter protein CcmD [Aestuariibacter salexigens]|uniref:heme exporter protein CcmD n=1 Tax=Aestuariibacter salexigens TaxID=226010 RepID=UPI00047E87B8|nr:heme exporter protein CcmD [Aestuariibacter salexigens]